MTDISEFPELYIPLPIDRLKETPEKVALRLISDDARAALTAFLDVKNIEAFTGDVEITRHGTIVKAVGSLKARLVRECVASLEPLVEDIETTFEEHFSTNADPTVPREEVEADLDAPEPLDGDVIDAGSVLIEQLVLAMDPHPRKADATPIEDPGAGARISPFDVLKDLAAVQESKGKQ